MSVVCLILEVIRFRMDLPGPFLRLRLIIQLEELECLDHLLEAFLEAQVCDQ